jgi:hypothetical protein
MGEQKPLRGEGILYSGEGIPCRDEIMAREGKPSSVLARSCVPGRAGPCMGKGARMEVSRGGVMSIW